MADWADMMTDRIGEELDSTPHKNNADYVDHFSRLISKSLRDAYHRGLSDAGIPVSDASKAIEKYDADEAAGKDMTGIVRPRLPGGSDF